MFFELKKKKKKEVYFGEGKVTQGGEEQRGPGS